MKKMIVLLALLFAARPLAAQNTGAPLMIQLQFNNAAGAPLALGKLCSYAAGTSTPLATYSERTLTTSNSNPMVLTAGGYLQQQIYLDAAAYKFVLMTAGTDDTCSTGSVIGTWDYQYNLAALSRSSFATKLDDKVCHASQYAGATADVKIVNCIAALPSTGGTADVRGLEGAQSLAACPFTGVTKNVEVLLGAATFTLAANCVVPASVRFNYAQGTVISINTGITMTFSAVAWELFSNSHFSGAGTVTQIPSGILSVSRPVNSMGNLFIRTSDVATPDAGGELSLGGMAFDGLTVFGSISGRKTIDTPSDMGKMIFGVSNNGGTTQEVFQAQGRRVLLVGNVYPCTALCTGAPTLTALNTEPIQNSGNKQGGTLQVAGNSGAWNNVSPDSTGNARWTAIALQNNFRTYQDGDTGSTIDVDFYFTDNTPEASFSARIRAIKMADYYGANVDHASALTFWTLKQNSAFTNPPVERVRIDNNGFVGIGTTTITSGSTASTVTTLQAALEVQSPNSATNSFGQIFVRTYDVQAAGRGAQISLGGMADDAAVTTTAFGSIAGRKENSTTANYRGYLMLATSNNGGTNIDHVKIDYVGNSIFNVTGALLAQGATANFPYIPGIATGKPNGTPDVTVTGAVPLVYDSVNNEICVYWAGWKCSPALTN